MKQARRKLNSRDRRMEITRLANSFRGNAKALSNLGLEQDARMSLVVAAMLEDHLYPRQQMYSDVKASEQ